MLRSHIAPPGSSRIGDWPYPVISPDRWAFRCRLFSSIAAPKSLRRPVGQGSWLDDPTHSHGVARKRMMSAPRYCGIAHITLARTSLGLVCQGKNDFELVEQLDRDEPVGILKPTRAPDVSRRRCAVRRGRDEGMPASCLLAAPRSLVVAPVKHGGRRRISGGWNHSDSSGLGCRLLAENITFRLHFLHVE